MQAFVVTSSTLRREVSRWVPLGLGDTDFSIQIFLLSSLTVDRQGFWCGARRSESCFGVDFAAVALAHVVKLVAYKPPINVRADTKLDSVSCDSAALWFAVRCRRSCHARVRLQGAATSAIRARRAGTADRSERHPTRRRHVPWDSDVSKNQRPWPACSPSRL